MAEKQLTFGVRIPVDTNAKEAASSVDQLRARIQENQNAVKSYAATLRALRGSSEEVKTTKEKLKAALNAEKDAMSRNAIALTKLGKGVLDNTKKDKDAASAIGKVRAALKAAGGPANELTGQIGALSGMLGSAGGAAGIAALGVGGLIAALAALSAAAVGALVSLGRFIVEGANELRTMNLFREAATGSAENAKAFGTQIEALATKIPTSRKALNDLSLSLSKSLMGTRVSGQGMVDIFNAVAQSSSAMGDSAGKAIEDILTRGKQFGRMNLGLFELQGTGLQFGDVASQLAKNLKIGTEEAKNALYLGRIKIDDGAKAIREVVERRFGKINARLMLDLPTMAAKFKETLVGLTKDVNLEPLLNGFSAFLHLFSPDTVTGAGIKHLIESFMTGLGGAIKFIGPLAKVFFEQLVLEALRLENVVLDIALWFKKTFGGSFLADLDLTEAAILAAKAAMTLFAGGLLATAAAIGVVVAAFATVGAVIYGAVEAFKDLYNWFANVDWGNLGTSIIDGIVGGIKSGIDKVKKSVTEVVNTIKKSFVVNLGIGSPSKVAREYGQDTTSGYALGVTDKSSKASSAVAAMVAIPARASPVGMGGGGGDVSVTVHAHFPNAREGADVSRALTNSSFEAQLLRVIERVSRSRGAQTQVQTAEVT